MKARWAPVAALLLAACSQSEAPSEEVEEAAQEVVRAVEGEPPQQAEGRYAPRNECAELPGAPAFLRELNEAVAARDADALAALAAEDIKLDFGDGSGTAELRRRLAAADGALWGELAQLTTLGCAVNPQGGLTLPWYFEQRIGGGDPFATFIVTGEDVPIRDAPSSDAPVVVRIDWDAVELVREEGREQEGYRYVRLMRGPEGLADVGVVEGGRPSDRPAGYAAEDMLRSIVDYRLTAASRNGRWRIISFVAGD